MQVAIEGAFVGLGVALFLLAAEYLLLKKAVNERAVRLKRKVEFGQTERARILSMARFSVLLPAAFALGFWIVGG